MSREPRLGISACLAGREVRHDGRHKRSDFLTGALAPHVELVPVCPEVEIGLPVPRDTLQLVGGRDRPRLIEGATGRDHTASMERWASARIGGLADLDGFALKKGSPSCGVERVPVFAPDDMQTGADGSGLFAAAVRRALPALPLTQETWLDQPELRERFLVQLFTHHRLRTGLAVGGLPALHAAHRLLYLARDPDAEAELARIAADPDCAGEYMLAAMAALALDRSPDREARALAAEPAGSPARLLHAEPYPRAIGPR